MFDEIRVILADDHNVLRQGMAQALNAQPDMNVVGQASNGIEALELTRQHQPDVVLMDINMPEMDGVETARRIMREWPQTGVIILTMYRSDDYVFEAIKAGASGYLLKEVELEELLAAVRAVSQGEAVIDPAIAGRVLAELRHPRPPKQKYETEMSERDLEILRLLAQGLKNQEIADRITISEKTVRNRLSLLFRRLHLENRTQAVLYALREGLADSTDTSEDGD